MEPLKVAEREIEAKEATVELNNASENSIKADFVPSEFSGFTLQGSAWSVAPIDARETATSLCDATTLCDATENATDISDSSSCTIVPSNTTDNIVIIAPSDSDSTKGTIYPSDAIALDDVEDNTLALYDATVGPIAPIDAYTEGAISHCDAELDARVQRNATELREATEDDAASNILQGKTLNQFDKIHLIFFRFLYNFFK